MRKLTFLMPFLLVAVTAVAAQPELRFGLIADVQYCDSDPWYGRHFRNSLSKLDRAVHELNGQKVDLTVNLGDLIDRDFADMDTVLYYLAQLDADLYNITGNHDYAGVKENEILYGKLGMPGPYYSFRRGSWVFLMLDTNDIASYSNMDGQGKREELEAMRRYIGESGRDNGHSWNGGIGREQLDYIDRHLAQAEGAGMNVMVFTHNPLYPFNDHTALNEQEILDVLTAYPCVKVVFSGHNHAGGFGYYGSLPCITVRGMVETPDHTSFAIVELYPERIAIKGYGDMDSYSFDIRR